MIPNGFQNGMIGLIVRGGAFMLHQPTKFLPTIGMVHLLQTPPPRDTCFVVVVVVVAAAAVEQQTGTMGLFHPANLVERGTCRRKQMIQEALFLVQIHQNATLATADVVSVVDVVFVVLAVAFGGSNLLAHFAGQTVKTRKREPRLLFELQKQKLLRDEQVIGTPSDIHDSDNSGWCCFVVRDCAVVAAAVDFCFGGGHCNTLGPRCRSPRRCLSRRFCSRDKTLGNRDATSS